MKKLIIGLAALVVLATSALTPTLVLAACGQDDTTPKGQVLTGAGQTGIDCEGVQVNNTIAAVVNILSLVVGIAAIIVIIISGLNYVTSGGDSGKVSSAKTSLIFALVGLAIAAIAQVLVFFVLDTVDKTVNPETSDTIKTSSSIVETGGSGRYA